ncbi:DUF1648 domain-containing protein [Allonocardiopsis opalescens]|uniref:Putative membrane protein n=1 Tax=Allonocardiopsis opalescens TaxID=1144618 RepID=A0A2T0QFR9_9ACTN|nr:DUF5808 domain-containing protein [Allonocardiopsis opalescens]PRY02745.1 putative membrane protein [Allonocardiopsis opalescens]
MIVQLATTLVPVAAATGTYWLVPVLHRPTMPLGTRVPPQRTADPVVTASIRTYQTGTLWLSLLAALAGSAVALTVGADWEPGTTGALASGALLIGVAALYVRGHLAIRRAKERDDWYGGLRQSVAADTSLRSDPVRYPWVWVLPSAALVLATALVGLLLYPGLPGTLVFSGSGAEPVATTPLSAFGLVFVMAAQTALMAGLVWLTLRARPDLEADRPHTTARQYRTFTPTILRATVALLTAVNLGMAVMSVLVWTGAAGDLALTLAVAVPVVPATAWLVLVAVRMGQSGWRVPVPEEAGEDTGRVQRDDDRHWILGQVYINRHDPSFLVAKRIGVGWTVNVGNPWGLALTAVLVAFVALTVVLGVLGYLPER